MRRSVLAGAVVVLATVVAPGVVGVQAAETAGDAGFIVTGSRNGDGFGLVRVFADNDANGTYETLVDEFVPYSTKVPGGVRVATGDFDGDGNDELVTASDQNAAVKIYELTPSGAPGALFDSVPGFTQGTYVAAGDLNGDGLDELVLGADPGGEPRVRIYADANADGELDAAPVNSFNAYPAAGNDGGVRVATGDTDGDIDDELIAAPGPDPGLPVKIYDDTNHDRRVSDNPVDDNFVPYEAGFSGGVYVAAGGIASAGDGGADVIVSPASGQNRNVVIRTDTDGDGKVSDDPAFDQLPPPYGASFASGTRVAAGDTDHSGSFVEVITAPGANAGSKPVKVYDDDDGDPGALLSDNPLDDQFTAFSGNFGVFVAFARVNTATYTDTDTPLAIPDDGAFGDPLQAEIRVPRSAGIVRDLNVHLDIRHTFDADLNVSLTHTSSSGTQRAVLFSNVGHNDDGFLVWLNDEEATDIATVPDDPNDRPVTGEFKPESPSLLSAFDGFDGSGRWILTVDDTSTLDVGTLQNWSLRITY